MAHRFGLIVVTALLLLAATSIAQPPADYKEDEDLLKKAGIGTDGVISSSFFENGR
jgi:hypothetical protein